MIKTRYKDYNIIGSFSINEFENSVNDLYRLLLPLKKEVYQPDERIVLYAREFDSDIKKHISNVCEDLDIDQFFVLLDTDETYPSSTNRSNMIPLPKHFCPLPWIAVNARAQLRPCCLLDGSAYKNIQDSTVEDMYFSDSSVSIREQFRQGKKPAACYKCWESVDAGHLAPIDEHRKYYRFDFHQLTFENETLDNILLLELDPGNHCNLKCRNCNPRYSSKIAAEQIEERKKLGQPIDDLLEANRLSQYFLGNEFWEKISTSINQVRYINFFGGEPLLFEKQQKQMLDYLISNNQAHNVRLHYNTNGTIFPTNLVDRWKHFREVDVAFSIDNTGKKYEIEREGANWDQVIANIQKFNELDIKTSIYVTVSTMNVLDLVEIDDYFASFDIPVHYTNVSYDPFGLKTLSTQAREAVIEKLSTREKFAGIVDLIKQLPEPKPERFIERMQRLDQLRNTNFADSHPEISELMNYRQRD